MRILVAEDDATSQELLKLNLESWGYQVTVCDDGKQALQAMSQLDTHRVAVLDWMMPELSGVDVCRQVRQFDHGRLIYIILLTARNQREDLLARVLAETAGAALYEINQPLAIALGKLDLLLMKLGDESPFLKDVDAIQHAVYRIEDIVKKIGSARKYVAKPYIQGVDIVDIDASAKD